MTEPTEMLPFLCPLIISIAFNLNLLSLWRGCLLFPDLCFEKTFWQIGLVSSTVISNVRQSYEGHLESKERFAIKKYLLIIGKKKNMQVLSHTFTYFST
jgi:hypothetical protein